MNKKVAFFPLWRGTPEKGGSQRVAMTAHFQVWTFEVRTLFQAVYYHNGSFLFRLKLSISYAWIWDKDVSFGIYHSIEEN